MLKDVALTESKDGTIVVHRAECVHVRVLAELGFPIATLFGIQSPLPDEYERHSCMKGEQ